MTRIWYRDVSLVWLRKIESAARRPNDRSVMMRSILVLLFGVFAAMSGCKTPSVSIVEMSPKPLIEMHANDTFSVQPGFHQTASAHRVVPSCRLSNDNEVLITGSLALVNSRSEPVAQMFDLKALGFHPESSGSPLSFSWVDPDGTKTLLKQIGSPKQRAGP